MGFGAPDPLRGRAGGPNGAATADCCGTLGSKAGSGPRSGSGSGSGSEWAPKAAAAASARADMRSPDRRVSFEAAGAAFLLRLCSGEEGAPGPTPSMGAALLRVAAATVCPLSRPQPLPRKSADLPVRSGDGAAAEAATSPSAPTARPSRTLPLPLPGRCAAATSATASLAAPTSSPPSC